MTATNTKTSAWTITLLLRCALVALACAGLYVTMFTAGGGFMGTSSLVYYTIQSNLWAMVFTLAAIVWQLRRAPEPGWFRMLRFIIAVAVMVTLLVFWAMLAPTMPSPDYLFSLSNLTLHTLVPLLMLADALFLDADYLPTKKQTLLCALPPLYYLSFAMVRAEVSDALLSDGSRYPYWFLDVDQLGLIARDGRPGVLFWVLVVVAIVLGLGYGLRAIKKLRLQRPAQAASDDQTVR